MLDKTERLIAAFAKQKLGLEIDRWPDKVERNKKEIDAVCGNYAIEHTSIDTFPQQREQDDHFRQFIDGLAECCPSDMGGILQIGIIEGGIRRRKSKELQSIRTALKTWIADHSKSFPLTGNTWRRIDVPVEGYEPFAINVSKFNIGKDGIFFGRHTPSDYKLEERLKDLISRKARKLDLYLEFTRILILESNDFSLMNPSIMAEALKKTLESKLPQGVDELWFADNSIEEFPEFHDFSAVIKR